MPRSLRSACSEILGLSALSPPPWHEIISLMARLTWTRSSRTRETRRMVMLRYNTARCAVGYRDVYIILYRRDIIACERRWSRRRFSVGQTRLEQQQQLWRRRGHNIIVVRVSTRAALRARNRAGTSYRQYAICSRRRSATVERGYDGSIPLWPRLYRYRGRQRVVTPQRARRALSRRTRRTRSRTCLLIFLGHMTGTNPGPPERPRHARLLF